MCTNTRYIRNSYTGKIVLVNCGHCESCRQQKASRLTRRIRFQHVEDSKSNKVQMFVTLTYASRWVPYVLATDIQKLASSRLDEHHVGCHFDSVPIYRDAKIKRGFGTSFSVYGQNVVLTKDVQAVPFHLSYDEINKIHLNQKHGNGKIGVINYKDLQDFIKRLKVNCERYIDLSGKTLRFFSTAEYGETTFRPHFHLLVTIPADKVEGFRQMVRKSWIYGHFDKSNKRISVARDCSRYVASYVNQPTDLPVWLSTFFPTKHSFSFYYGFDSKYFTFEKVREMVERGDMHLPIFFDKSREQYSLSLLLPHVVSRYFPKFKGLCRLSPSEILSILRRPSTIGEYSQRLELTFEDCKNTVYAIERGRSRCGCASKKKGVFYANLWLKAWTVYKQNVLSDWYKQQQENKDSPPTEFYDNVGLPEGSRLRHQLHLFLYDPALNPNNQQWRKELTSYYTEKYNKLVKEKKVNYLLYGES